MDPEKEEDQIRWETTGEGSEGIVWSPPPCHRGDER